MTFPERVLRARTKRHLTQRQLSEAAKKKPTYVAQIEIGGIEKPSYEAMVGMATALRVPIEWLADGDGEEPTWDESDDAPDTEPAAP